MEGSDATVSEDIKPKDAESLTAAHVEIDNSGKRTHLDSSTVVKFSNEVASRLLSVSSDEEVQENLERIDTELVKTYCEMSGDKNAGSTSEPTSQLDSDQKDFTDVHQQPALIKEEVSREYEVKETVAEKHDVLTEALIESQEAEKESKSEKQEVPVEYNGKGDHEPKIETLQSSLPNDGVKKKDVPGTAKGVSIFDYVYSELRRGYLLENDKQRFSERREKFYMFFKIPRELEKFITYGFFQCVDAFLFIFTFLPLRSVLSVWFLVIRSLYCIAGVLFSSRKVPARLLQPAEICDLLKGVIVIGVSYMMAHIDTSMMYHIVKSQSVIKLYIMFNMLEVADKLFSAFGQDILDALYWTATEARGRKRDILIILGHFFASVIYVFSHSLIVLLQATTLSVAINYPNTALLTVMLSNNFVELKSMVFKKFEKNNLFQMSCSDVRERFHFLILLFIVILQTMKQYNWDYDQFLLLLPYCIGVLGVEVAVDWMKHAFVTRFNEISDMVYSDYTVSLAYDLASCKLKSAFSDHTDLISRRMGFIPLPLGALVLRVVFGSIPIVGFFGYVTFFLCYLCLVTTKLWISIALLGKACCKIEAYRASQKEKLPSHRQCNSLPSSRHHSTEDLRGIMKTAKSMPQSQCASVSSSLADIAAQAEIRQETIEHNPLFSNSTVMLDNVGKISENVFVSEQFGENKSEVGETWKSTETFGGVLRVPPHDTLKRRISLQERVGKDEPEV